MPGLNEKDHKTVFITDGKSGLKKLIQGIFTNIEVSECTFSTMKVSLMKRLSARVDRMVFYSQSWSKSKAFLSVCSFKEMCN